MDEKQLRAEEANLVDKRKALEDQLADVRERLAAVRRDLLPYSQDQKRQDKRLENGVDARKRAQTEAALFRSRQAAALREEGKTWQEVGDAIGVTAGRARSVGTAVQRLERALKK